MNKLLVLLAITMMVTACNSKSSGGGGGSPDNKPETPEGEPQPPPIVVTPFDIGADSVADPAGCMNLQKLYDRMRVLPADGRVRLVTMNVVTKPQGDDAPSKTYPVYLANTSYEYVDLSLQEFAAMYFPKVDQRNCTKATLSDGERGTADFSISLVELKPTYVSLKGQGRAQTYRLTGPRELTITRTASAMDLCSDGLSFPVEKTIVVRWGAAADLDPVPEAINKKLLERLKEGRLVVPERVTALLQDPATPISVPLSAPDLKALYDAEVDRKILACAGSEN